MRPIVLLAVLALAGGCAYGGPGASPTSQPPTTPSTATPTASPTASPASVPPPTSSAGMETTSPTPTPGSSKPPDGLLSAGSESVAGWLGSYCWSYSDGEDETDACADAFRTPPRSTLPFLAVPPGARAELTFSVAGGVEFSGWTATYSARSNSARKDLHSGGHNFDSETTASQPPLSDEVRFPSPPSGDWVVHVFVYFVNGDASYHWHVAVP